MGFQRRKFQHYKKKVQEPKQKDIKVKKAPICDVYSAAPCFSGECGLCANCCKTQYSSKLSEREQRYKDMAKILGKPLIEEYREVYNKRLNSWCKNKGYTDPFLYGYARERVKVVTETYTLCKNFHSNVCDDSYCRALYTSTDEYTQKTKYSKYPIYTSDTRDIKLCGVCIDRM